MKSIAKITVELLVTISMIALMALLAALVYALLSLMTPSADAYQLPATTPLIPSTVYAIPSNQSAPEITAKEIPDYSKMTVKQLKPMARDRKIANWSRLNKKELVAALSTSS